MAFPEVSEHLHFLGTLVAFPNVSENFLVSSVPHNRANTAKGEGSFQQGTVFFTFYSYIFHLSTYSCEYIPN